MLPDIDLDSERFDDIIEYARNNIVSIYPEWSDLNYHDPGMTMLEMFAWLKEMQQYSLNRIGTENIEKYLKLVGVRRKTKKPSKTWLTVEYDEDLTVSGRTRFYAGDICFEADDKTYISSSKIVCCIRGEKDDRRIITGRELDFGGNLRMIPFKHGKNGRFLIGFDKPLAENFLHHIYIGLRENDTTPRNPITDHDSFIPLVDMEMKYYSGGSWHTAECKDETYGFLYSGTIAFSLSSEHEKCAIEGQEGYFICFELIDGEYDTLPVINSIDFSLLPVTQRETKAEYADYPPSDIVRINTDLAQNGVTKVFLKDHEGMYIPVSDYEKKLDPITGEIQFDIAKGKDLQGVRIVNIDHNFYPYSEIGFGLGLPFQEYDLETTQIEYESFAIMTEMPDSGGRFAEWKRVNDFSTARPEDLVYVLDSQKGIVKFGDCIRGTAPEGRIFIVGYAVTRGGDGNVSQRKINTITDETMGQLNIYNRRRSLGGTDEETLEECCARAQKLLDTTETLVTDKDCEDFVCGIQGLKIQKCQVIHEQRNSDSTDELVTAMVVKCCTDDGMGVPGGRYMQNIIQALESRRMMGMRFRIIKPSYTGVTVYGDIDVTGDSETARKIMVAEIAAYFESVKDHFGIMIEHSRLYDIIDKIECVIAIRGLSIQGDGSGSQYTQEGDLQMLPNVACYLSEMDLTVKSY